MWSDASRSIDGCLKRVLPSDLLDCPFALSFRHPVVWMRSIEPRCLALECFPDRRNRFPANLGIPALQVLDRAFFGCSLSGTEHGYRLPATCFVKLFDAPQPQQDS